MVSYELEGVTVYQAPGNRATDLLFEAGVGLKIPEYIPESFIIDKMRKEDAEPGLQRMPLYIDDRSSYDEYQRRKQIDEQEDRPSERGVTIIQMSSLDNFL
jgi:hypothetical protein